MKEEIIAKIYESRIFHDYKDGKIDFRGVAQYLRTLKC